MLINIYLSQVIHMYIIKMNTKQKYIKSKQKPDQNDYSQFNLFMLHIINCAYII